MTIWMFGAGIKGGQVIGASDEFGYKAEEQPISYHDLHATMLHLLGLDHKRLTYRFNGRDMRLTDVYGTLVPQIVASGGRGGDLSPAFWRAGSSAFAQALRRTRKTRPYGRFAPAILYSVARGANHQTVAMDGRRRHREFIERIPPEQLVFRPCLDHVGVAVFAQREQLPVVGPRRRGERAGRGSRRTFV